MVIYDVIIKDTHRGLFYEDGVLTNVLEAGRYRLRCEPVRLRWVYRLRNRNKPRQEILLVDMRERDLTIKGQEILTADKVAIRVSIIVQFRVIDPRAALHAVASYETRLYSDVQLAARRSLATMTLEEILTNRNRLNEDIMQDVREAAAGYGVKILQANVKDIVFPGNLQTIMNRVLTAERQSQAELVEARTRAEVQRIDAEARAETARLKATADADAKRQAANADAAVQQINTQADLNALRERADAAGVFVDHPALLRLLELDTLREMAGNGNARLYINFDKDLNDE